MDSGGSWDYAAGRADFSQSHPSRPFVDRHDTLLGLSALSLFAAGLYLLILYRVSRESSEA